MNIRKLSLSNQQKRHLKKVYAWVKRRYLTKEKSELVRGGYSLDHVQRVAGMSAVLSSMERVDHSSRISPLESLNHTACYELNQPVRSLSPKFDS